MVQAETFLDVVNGCSFLSFPLGITPSDFVSRSQPAASKGRCWRLSLSRCSLCTAWPTVAVQTDLVSHARTQLTHEETYNTRRTKKGFDTMYWYLAVPTPGDRQRSSVVVSPFKAWSSSNYSHALPRIFSLSSILSSRIFTFFLFSLHLLSLLFNCVLANAVTRVGPQNEIGHPAYSHKRFKQVPIVSAYGI